MHNHEKTWPYWKPEPISTYRTSTACNSPSLVHVKTCKHTQSMRTEGGKNKKNKSLAHMYTHTGQQNEFLWVHSGESCMGTENSVTTSDRRVCLPGTD